jgi:hypothetical protein
MLVRLVEDVPPETFDDYRLVERRTPLLGASGRRAAAGLGAAGSTGAQQDVVRVYSLRVDADPILI